LTDLAINDYHMVMKNVRIAELKSRLSEHLRAVKRGETIVVLERDSPIARITPLEARRSPLVVRPRPARAVPLAGLSLPAPLKLRTDVVALLIKERGAR
jgi:antitoxin (DNA-binding transcriptional repressor) of toxin-antitoxin stability system